eukprot:g63807.t1
MGLLSKGDVLLKNPSDFVGDVIGSSEKNTRSILQAAEGCVLVIDEAYSFYAGDDVNKINDPTRQRRFQLENTFNFIDYDDLALLHILQSKAKKKGLNISLKVAKGAVASLAKVRAKPNFGNAGSVENMLSNAKLALQRRLGAASTNSELTLEDFGVEGKGQGHVLDRLFEGMIGCDSIKNKLEVLRNTVEFASDRGDDPMEKVCFNWLFLGDPGTGKTTIAR